MPQVNANETLSTAQQIEQKELKRQAMVIQGRAQGAGADATSIPLSQFVTVISYNETPMERFCLIDLVGDADALYGRVQWGVDTLPAEERQRHADFLLLLRGKLQQGHRD